MFEVLLNTAEIVEKNLFPLLMYSSITVIFVGAIIFYFYSKTETSQAIKVLKKYQHTEFQELEVLEDRAAGRRFFMLKGPDNQKLVSISRTGKIREINE
ncbi:hypothetical protein [Planomicrobium okeanokoites]|uniref:hypothetical protein n=1 Tax=Planomicrobium okeanokoites TaxID=244 RepID=UPI000A0206DB|nr:hypothetical protein [Planomicrobium okeanokoites]